MTGYGSSRVDSSGIKVRVEVKTLNSKYLDALIKLPKEFGEYELEVRSLVGDILERGKVSLTLEYESESGTSVIKINEAVFLETYQSLKSLATKAGASYDNLFETVLQLPEVILPQEEVSVANEWQLVSQAIKEAIKACDAHRVSEGQKLSPVLEKNVLTIEEKLKEVEKADPKRIEGIKGRISGNLKEHFATEKIDENRFEQEVIYFLEKLDITEEKVRLKSHIHYFLEVLGSKTSQGKKLGFIAQEIGREINTIGSKANNAEIQHLVVEMKEELEKVREQLLNIL